MCAINVIQIYIYILTVFRGRRRLSLSRQLLRVFTWYVICAVNTNVLYWCVFGLCAVVSQLVVKFLVKPEKLMAIIRIAHYGLCAK